MVSKWYKGEGLKEKKEIGQEEQTRREVGNRGGVEMENGSGQPGKKYIQKRGGESRRSRRGQNGLGKDDMWEGKRHRISTARKVKGGGLLFLPQIEPN